MYVLHLFIFGSPGSSLLCAGCLPLLWVGSTLQGSAQASHGGGSSGWSPGPSFSAACETFLDQGLNLGPLCWQEDSLALNYQRSLKCFYFFVGLPWGSLDFTGLGQRMKLPMQFQRKHTSSLSSGVGASHTREFSVWMAFFEPVRYLLKYILGLKIHYSPEVGLPDKDSGNWRE